MCPEALCARSLAIIPCSVGVLRDPRLFNRNNIDQQSSIFLSLVSSFEMHRLPILLLSLIPYHLTVFALTLPLTTPNLTAESTPSNVLTNSEPHCASEAPTTSLLPLSPDCTRAIRSLPQSPYIGIFHLGGAATIWRLPDSRSYDTCTVFVTLNADFDSDLGSWVGIADAAFKLLLACRLPFEEGGEQRTGGWIAAGAENGLVVELRRSSFGEGDGTGVGMQGAVGVD